MSGNILHDGHNLRRGLQVVGTCFLLAGAGTAAYLYQSFGVNVPEKAIYGFVGVLLAASAALMLPAAITLWRSDKPGLGVVAGLLWLFALFPLGVQHHAGFFSVAQADLAASGLGAQAVRAKLEALEVQAKQYGAAADFDMAAAQSQAGKLEAELDAARSALAACPASHKTNCIQPRTAALGDIRAKLRAVQGQIESAGELSRVSSEKAQAAAELAQVSGGGLSASTVHPLFDTQGKILGVAAGKAQAVFLGFTALTVELLSALLFVFAGAMGEKALQPALTVPSLDVGGRVEREGLAHVHAGETVLNAGASTELDKLYPGLADKLNALMQSNDLKIKSMPKQGNGLQVISCESCGAQVMQRTVWQRFCPARSAQRRAGVLKAKARRKA